MASSGSSNDDFQSRVAKSFGSLAFSRPSSSKFSTSSAPASRQQSGSVWTLSDAEVEKREWNRDSYDRDEIPCASSFDELLRQQKISAARKPLEDDQGEDCDDVLSIRASMGLDRTLDDEAEEDEYDKVALGKEDDGEGLSMKGGRTRDPRANYVAAKIRLKEDEIEANKLKAFANQPSKSKEPQTEESSKVVPPKPILKRKENSSDSEARISKRVRFDVVSEETAKKREDIGSASTSAKSIAHQGKSGAQVPDYLLNPSKYTRYTFDPSCELNKSPTEEYMNIPKAVEGLKPSDSESFKKVSFIPQKKTKDVREDSSNCSETKPTVVVELAEDETPNATEDGVTETGELESSTHLVCDSISFDTRYSRLMKLLESINSTHTNKKENDIQDLPMREVVETAEALIVEPELQKSHDPQCSDPKLTVEEIDAIATQECGLPAVRRGRLYGIGDLPSSPLSGTDPALVQMMADQKKEIEEFRIKTQMFLDEQAQKLQEQAQKLQELEALIQSMLANPPSRQ